MVPLGLKPVLNATLWNPKIMRRYFFLHVAFTCRVYIYIYIYTHKYICRCTVCIQYMTVELPVVVDTLTVNDLQYLYVFSQYRLLQSVNDRKYKRPHFFYICIIFLYIFTYVLLWITNFSTFSCHSQIKVETNCSFPIHCYIPIYCEYIYILIRGRGLNLTVNIFSFLSCSTSVKSVMTSRNSIQR